MPSLTIRFKIMVTVTLKVYESQFTAYLKPAAVNEKRQSNEHARYVYRKIK